MIKAATLEAPKKNKYNATKAVFYIETEKLEKIDTVKYKELRQSKMEGYEFFLFDSYHEGLYYKTEVLPLVKGGKASVTFQPKYTLVPSFALKGKKHMAVTYTPDFRVDHINGEIEVIDVKGMEDQKFPIKRKLFDHLYPELGPLIVIKYVVKFGGFITDEVYAKCKKEENKQKKAKAL